MSSAPYNVALLLFSVVLVVNHDFSLPRCGVTAIRNRSKQEVAPLNDARLISEILNAHSRFVGTIMALTHYSILSTLIQPPLFFLHPPLSLCLLAILKQTTMMSHSLSQRTSYFVTHSPFLPLPLLCHALPHYLRLTILLYFFAFRLNNGYESLFLFQNLKAIGEPIKLTHIARTVESMSYTNSKLLDQRPILTFMTVKNANTGETGESM
jgi:hypothetical protein